MEGGSLCLMWLGVRATIVVFVAARGRWMTHKIIMMVALSRITLRVPPMKHRNPSAGVRVSTCPAGGGTLTAATKKNTPQKMMQLFLFAILLCWTTFCWVTM